MFTGSSSDKFTIRILPALNLKKSDADAFLDALKAVLEKSLKNA
jgi:acetylornithine aminotransferase